MAEQLELTPEEIMFIFGMLDRVSITGHKERESMNVVVTKLTALHQQATMPDEANED